MPGRIADAGDACRADAGTITTGGDRSPSAILAAAGRWRPRPSNLERLRPLWAAHAAAAREQLPEAVIEGDGEDLHLGPLSPGCRACRDGTWDCVFLASRCNLDCSFCCSPRAVTLDAPRSALGATRQAIAAAHERTGITGISFSGGEPFLDVPLLCAWLSWFKARWPGKYYWVYTNGVLASERHTARLGALGLDEMRFNLAATGYRHPDVLRHVAAASRHIPRVTVEIPAIPAHATELLASLACWSACGVRHLNLHELLYEPGSRSAELAGARTTVILPDGHRTAVDPGSRELTLAAMRAVREQGLPLAVNDCSLQGKLRQLRGRRRSVAPLALGPHESMVADERYESGLAYRDDRDFHFFHPDAWAAARVRYAGHRFARVARLAPLAVDEPPRWIRFEPVADG
jgi:pyruvate formate-lyase activating enzyme-like uncharacterized protein